MCHYMCNICKVCVCVCVPGEVLGEIMSVLDNPEGLRQLVNLPAGSAEAELAGLLPLVHVYRYLETARRWGVLGEDVQKNSEELSRRIKNGEERFHDHDLSV